MISFDRGSKIQNVKKIDLFPKVKESYKQTSTTGGALSIISFMVIFWLIYTEVRYYLGSRFIFTFSPDVDMDTKLQINVDLTVAMPCSSLGADIIDSTNENTYKFGVLQEEDTWFELANNQQKQFEYKRHFNSYLREEYHAIKDLLWQNSFSSLFTEIPPRKEFPDKPHDACRIYGSLGLNKVSGNFHVTAGKSLNLPRGHIHISAFMKDRDYNFSHRIDRFSFGEPSSGLVYPLEGDEFIDNNGMVLFQYFIEVVPTNIKTFLTSLNTYQYSVKELSRPIDHDKGSHGMPGIFFKYDVSALKVTIRQEREYLGMFLSKLCSIVGGIYICSGFLNNFIQYIYKRLLMEANS